MQAGRDLDALIAEKVMGWTLVDETPWPEHRRPGVQTALWYRSPSGMLRRVSHTRNKTDDTAFAPSDQIDDAWNVVEALQRRAGELSADVWEALYRAVLANEPGEPPRLRPSADAAREICRVALRVVLGEVPQ